MLGDSPIDRGHRSGQLDVRAVAELVGAVADLD